MKEVDIMPELPEVETVKNGLLKKVKNRKILSCNVLWPGIIAYPDKETFIKKCIIKDGKQTGQKIENI